MSEGREFEVARSRYLIDEMVRMLAPACSRLEIAGSIRRGAYRASDVELLAIPLVSTTPLTQPALFGTPEHVATVERDHLLERLDQLLADRVIATPAHDSGRARAWGAKHRAWVYQGIPFDLYTALPEAWGAQLLIRTGPASLSKAWVSELRKHGLRMEGGVVIGQERVRPRGTVTQDVVLEVRREERAFGLVKWPVPPATDRDRWFVYCRR